MTHPGLVVSTVRCLSCGNEFQTRSTVSEIVLDVCSNCHPAYTGVARPRFGADQLDRFERRWQRGRYTHV